jgi:hypothetical protein
MKKSPMGIALAVTGHNSALMGKVLTVMGYHLDLIGHDLTVMGLTCAEMPATFSEACVHP